MNEATLAQVVVRILERLGFFIEHHKKVIGNTGVEKEFDLMATQTPTNKTIAIDFKKNIGSEDQVTDFQIKTHDVTGIAEKILISEDYEQNAADVANANRIQLWDRQKISEILESTKNKFDINQLLPRTRMSAMPVTRITIR